MRGRSAFLLTCSILAFIFAACGSKQPSLEGRWVGNYAMFPAIFDFHGDSVAVTLAGKFQEDRFEHADSNGAAIIHVVRPNVYFKMIFVRDDSAVVIVNAREKIAIVKQ